MNIDDFLNTIYESSWRSNMKHEVQSKLNKIIFSLQENQDQIVDEIMDNIQRMEELKLEQKDEFCYPTFKKWLDYYSKEVIDKKLEELK